MKTVEFKFSPGSFVLIVPLDNTRGRVLRCLYSGAAEPISYEIEYWIDGTQRHSAVYEDELLEDE